MGTKRLSIVVAVLTGLLAISSVAFADHDEPRDDDTTVSFGYDEVNHILAVNSGDNDTPYVCEFRNGALDATYVDILNGFFEIDSLMSGGSPWDFDARDASEVSHDYDPYAPGLPILYTGVEGECAVHGALVGGPNGQINHGQFMKAAKSLIDKKGRGCIVREFAHSDIGKTEATRLRTSDVEPLFEPADSGDIIFETFEADCSKPNKKGDRGDKGKSGEAPGHNKNGE